MPISSWFREDIKNQVRSRAYSRGGYLDGTMLKGESSAGTVKFPVAGGRLKMYELSGGLNAVPYSQVSLDMVSLLTRDYEASHWINKFNEARMGPSMRATIADALAAAVRRKKDQLKLDALNAFAGATSTLTDNPNTVTTIGDGTARVDIMNCIDATDQLAGAGSDAEVYWAIPNVWFSQLMMYKEFSQNVYLGNTDLPFMSNKKLKIKTFNSVHIMAIPDEHFIYGTGAFVEGTPGFTGTGYLDTFMWTERACGCETWADIENMSLSEHAEMEGTPALGKVQLSGAAIGLLPEEVKRVRMLAIKNAIRVA